MDNKAHLHSRRLMMTLLAIVATMCLLFGLFNVGVKAFKADAADYSYNDSVNYATWNDDTGLSVCFTCTSNGLDMYDWALFLFNSSDFASVGYNSSTHKLTNSGSMGQESASYYFDSNVSQDTGTITITYPKTVTAVNNSSKTLAQIWESDDWRVVIGPHHSWQGHNSYNCDYYVGSADAIQAESVTPEPGEIETDTHVGAGITASVSGLTEQVVVNNILTASEKQRRDNGEYVSVYLEIKPEGSTVIPAADKTAAQELLTAGKQEGLFLDLSLYKKVGTSSAVTVSEPGTSFDISIDIPNAIANVPYGYVRTYSIIRVHNGVAESLTSSVSNGVITFSTNKFSTYLIAYSDEFDDNGEYIEFTTSIVGDDIRYTNDIVADTTTVVVNYKITHNDGFNSILLIPKFDANVFAIDSISINETALGAATMTDGDGVMKIVLDNTGAKYEALDGENEFFLTVTYKFIAATAGEYDFSLVLSSNEENGKSEAFYIAEVGEQKGEQNRVAIKVISNVLTVYEKASIVIGYNDADVPSYQFTFGNQEVTVQKVETLGETTNFVAQYTYNGTATPVIKWYDSEMTEMENAPKHAGTYYLGISAPQNGVYNAVEEVLRLVVIAPKSITVTADNHGHTYGNSPVSLTPTTAGLADEIEVTFTVKDADQNVIELSSSTNVGSYTIVPSASHSDYIINIVNGTYTVTAREITITAENKGHVYGDQPAALAPTTAGLAGEIEVTFTVKNGDDVIVLSSATNVGTYTIIPSATNSNYAITLVNGTYTITKKALTVTASNQNAEYTGEEPDVDQTAYTVSIEGLTITGVTITKAEGVNVGTYELAIAYANNNYEITLVKGTFTITSASADVEEIKAYFGTLIKVYNGQNQDLLAVELLPDYVTSYNATGNVKKNVGTYEISVTVYVDENHTFSGEDHCVFVLEDAAITPAEITVTADNKNVYYGENPATPSYTLTGTVYEGDTLSVSFTVKDNGEAFTPDKFTNVGAYDIVVSAANANYQITLVDGKYNVLKATSDMVTINVAAEDIYYNRSLTNTITVTVNGVTLDGDAYTVNYLQDNEAITPVNAGEYTILVTVTGTDNYAEKQGTDTFEIKQVKLEGVTFTYSHGNVTWTVCSNDIGKTADETGVEAKTLKDGTTITYKVYNGETLIGTYNERTFDAAAAATYKVVAVASDANYIPSESVMAPAYAVTFDEGDHAANPSGVVSNMPSAQFIFEGQTVVAPVAVPTVDGCTFEEWQVSDVTYLFTEAVNGNIVIVAVWEDVPYTITLKYLDSSATLDTDVFVLELHYGDVVDYSALEIAPVKASDNAGISYTFANKWTDTESTKYTVSNKVIQGLTVTGDMTLVAVFDTNYNSFKVTYYFFDNDTNEYAQYGEEQVVTYNQTIDYRTYTGDDYAWFIKDYWYGNAARTSAVPVIMPAENISVYGAYKFNIGQGDVNADGNVSADDITLYRQWIVGGYEMNVIASGNEWATVTGANFDVTAKYYLKRVADNNADESRDIRDVSITRMAIVGGYDWDISTGTTVTGQNIDRTKTATSLENVINGLNEYGRARMYKNITDTTADVVFNVEGSLYLDLGGKTLTVKSFVLNTTGKNVTITVKNGTIITTNGITITAPNGNVVLEDLIGYVGETQVNLQAADHSLHFAGVVEFYADENDEPVPAPINIEKGTHVVIEEEAEITIEKIVVTENFEAAPESAITLDNNTTTTIIIEGIDETMVASVNGVDYESLVDAIAAVNASANGGTVTILTNIDFSDEIYAEYKWAGSTYNPLEIANDNVTLDLNGHSIYNMGNVAICLGYGTAAEGSFSNVTVKNGTLLAGTTNNVKNSYVLGISGIANATIKNVTTDGGINVYTGSTNVVIEDSAINGTKYYAVCAQCGSDVVIKNSTVTKNTDSSVATKAMFWIDKAGKDSDMATPENPQGNYVASSITIDGCECTLAAGGSFYLTSGLKPVIVNGTFNFDPTAYIAEGSIVCDLNGTWAVAPDLVKAVEIINASENGGTIKLVADIDFSTETYAGYKWAGSTYNPLTITNSNVIIDLNGHTISNMGNTALVAGNILAANGGIENFTIKNGTLLAGTTGGVTNSYVLGIAGVNGALIKNVTTLGGINVYTGSQNVVIDGCNVQGAKYYSVCAQCGSDVVIKNSTITKNTDSSVATKAMFWIDKAGKDSDMATPENPQGNYVASSITIDGCECTLSNGGVFYLTSGLKPVVKEGTFNFDPTACVYEGYVVIYDEGIYTVVLESEVQNAIYNGEQLIAAATVGGDYVLLADVEITTSVKIEKDFVLNGNNKTVTGTKNGNYYYLFEINDNDTAVLDATIKNVTINATGYQTAVILNADFDSTVTLNNVEITCDGSCVYSNGHAIAVLNDCELNRSGRYATGKDKVYYSALNVGYGGEIIANNTEITATGFGVGTFPSGGTVTLVNCTVSATEIDGVSGTGYSLYSWNDDYATYPEYCRDSVITLDSCAVSGAFKIDDKYTSGTKNLYIAKIVTDFDPSEYITGDLNVVEDGGIYTVSAK